MAPVIYARDEDRVARRIGWRLVSCGVWLAAAAFLVLYLLGVFQEAMRDHWPSLLALLCVPMLAGLLVMAFYSAQGERDWLRLDGNGITLSRRGHQAQWHWSRVASVRYYAWWHPLALLLGVSLRIDLAGGGHLTIADDFFTPLDEIADRLRETRDRALGLDGFAGRALASVTAPALVAEGPKIFRRRGMGWGPLDAAALTGAATALVGVLAPQLWSMDWSDIDAWARTLAAVVATTVFSLVFSVPKSIRGATAAGNFLLLSDDGLHLRDKGDGRHWRWPDVSGFALVREEADPEAGKEARRVIAFATRGSGGSRAGPADGEVHELVIEEVYDAPLEEILRRLEAWHAWASAAEPAVAEDPGAEVLLSFKRRPGANRGALATIAVWVGMGGNLLVMAAYLGLLVYLGTAGETRPEIGLWFVVLAAGSLLTLMPILVSYWLATRFSLEADANGLAYRRLGVTRRWAWNTLSTGEIREAETRWVDTRRRLLVIEAEEDDRLSRFTRWAYRLEGERPLIVIEDIFDTPLDEIAGRLEALRRAAPAEARAAPRRGGRVPPIAATLAGEGAH